MIGSISVQEVNLKGVISSEGQLIGRLTTTLPDGGYERGYSEGYETGSVEGYVKGQKEGYSGGYEEGKAESVDMLNGVLDRSITSLTTDATMLDDHALYNCKKLVELNIPQVETIGMNALSYTRITKIYAPKVTSVTNSGMHYCQGLKTADFLALNKISNNAFACCYSLTALIIRSETICTLGNTNAFSYCYHILGTRNSTHNPSGLKDGYIYVPDDLVDSYKSATNWSTYADQIKPLSEYEGDLT